MAERAVSAPTSDEAGWVGTEMELGLAAALEDQVLNGSGFGENLTGIGNVSGAQAQAFTTDLFVTARKAITKLEVIVA